MADETQQALFRDLPLRTKKQRQMKFQCKNLSAYDMKVSLQEMIKTGIKNAGIIELFKSGLLQEKTSSELKIRPKRVRSEAEEEIIAKIQDKDFNFFTAKGETAHFKRSIDDVLSKITAKKHSLQIKTTQEEPHPAALSLSPLKTKYSKFSKESSQMSRRRRTRKSESMPSKGVLQLKRVLMSDLNEARRRRSNTFLFNIPTRKLPKKTSQVEYQFQRDWEQQLLENINVLQGSNIHNKRNLKIEREKVSAYLRSKFINQVITTYYKFEPVQTFAFLKSTIEELVKLGEKELRLITFFTYDYNQDGFICEEDIYHFVSKLPHRSRILSDFNLIIEFLRTNQLRSTTANLPEKLLKCRQKSLFASLNDQSAPSRQDVPAKKKYSFTEKLFTVEKGQERESGTQMHQHDSHFKKFQINFEVFSLIFAERMPVLVPEIIMSFTHPIVANNSPCPSYPSSEVSTPLESKQKQWMKRMSRTKELLDIAHKDNLRLSQKIV